MIDVIIPAYNSHGTIERTLSSIAYQSIVRKLNVYIVNDCSDKDYSEQVEFYSNFMNVKEITLKKNGGPGVARREGLNNSSSEYVVFIDSDDAFYDCFAISNLYNKIFYTNSDVVVGNFVEEIDNDFYNHDNDTIWLHGKIYRRKFLEENDINFNDTRLNEDNGFNQLVFLSNAKVEYLNQNVYIWCNNSNSITRKNNSESLFDLLLGYIYNLSWALEIADSRCYDIFKIADLSYSALVAVYCHYLRFLDNESSDEVLKMSKRLKAISDKYPLDEDKQVKILQSQFSFVGDSMDSKAFLNSDISFSKFLVMIDEV